MIKETELYQADPFQFRLFPGSLACHRKGLSAPVLMVEVERDQVLMGLDYFCRSFDGENPLSPCGIPYPFFTLYQNQLSDDDRFRIIQDIQLHINDVDIFHLYGFELMVTLRQNVTIKLRKLLMALCANKTNHRLFLKVEKELDPEAIICVYNKTDKDMVMANLPLLSTYIKQCVIEEDFGKIFSYNDHSTTFPTKSVPVKVGKLQVNTRPILQDVQDHTTRTLNLMVSPGEKRAPSLSFSSVTSATYTSSSSLLCSSFPSHPSTAPKLLQPCPYKHKFH
jgi:hypothetical protein